MTTTRITHIGGPTALIEVGGWRLLTDPTFDPPGRRYSFGWDSSSHKLTGPAVAATDLGAIDAVLLSHDHQGDNLDAAGRSLLPAAGVVLTTAAGGGRLGGNTRGLQPGQPPGWRPRDARPSRSPPPLAGTARRSAAPSAATSSASPWPGRARSRGRCG
jgi:hypothetical protein